MKRLVLIFALTATLALLTVSPAFADPTLVGGCQVFPETNHWNLDISGADVHDDSDEIIAAINGFNGNDSDKVHPDFGGGVNDWYGIPWITVSGTQKKVPVTFDYDDESDPGPYPIPPTAPVEGGPGADGDQHVIVIDTDNCVLYETYYSDYVGGSQQAWTAGSGAIWNLDSNALRPDGWTSADAAGLPIFPGLARCEEAESGTINHAFRVTFSRTKDEYIYPATHEASNYTDEFYPPMGLRFRLKSTFSEASFTGQSLAIIRALKKYGMINADNGSNWFISGEYNPNCWDDDELNQLKTIPGTAFEVIESPAPATVILPTPTLSTPVEAEGVGSRPALIWNTITSATSYEVRLGTDAGSLPTVDTVNWNERTEYIPPAPLLTAKTYYWQVRANTPYGTTVWSDLRSFVIASPANAVPTQHRYTVSTPTLTWGEVTWATGYDVQISTSTSFTGATIRPAGSNLSYTVSPALTAGTYFWRVCAKNASGACAWSAPIPFAVDI